MNTVKLDSKKRATIAAGRPGQVMAVQEHADGSVTLCPVKADMPKPSILEGLKPLTKAECLAAWGPDADPEWDRIADAMSRVPASPPEE